MKSLINILICLTAIVAISCNSPAKKQEKVDRAWDSLYDEVMVIHDEIMPQLSQITKNQNKINKLDSASLNNKYQVQYPKVKLLLKKGEDSMWDWMHAFKQKDALLSLSDEEVTKYLNLEKGRISKVKVDMRIAIQESDTFLKNLSANK